MNGGERQGRRIATQGQTRERGPPPGAHRGARAARLKRLESAPRDAHVKRRVLRVLSMTVAIPTTEPFVPLGGSAAELSVQVIWA